MTLIGAATLAQDARAQSAAAVPPPAGSSHTSLPLVEVRGEAEKAESGTTVDIRGAELEQANSIADIVRYQPLVSAPGTAVGATRGRSNFERGGTTGYNIRGVEGNRVGMDIDGVEMPSATTRPYVSRAGTNTFGMGRDFMDPEMYSLVGIDSGTTGASRSAGGIGGAVSFRTKSSSDFLRNGKASHFEGKLGYDAADRSWHKAFTATGRNDTLDGLIVYSRRDGREVRNHSPIVDSAPEKWHSNALLLKGGLKANVDHHLQLTVDLYDRKNASSFFGWDADNEHIVESSRQNNQTGRRTVQLNHLWTPGWLDALDTRLYYQSTNMRDDTDTTALESGLTHHDMSQNRTKTWGVSSTGTRKFGRHALSFGANASVQRINRPWEVDLYMKPQPDSTTRQLGLFIQDEISLDVAGRHLSITPALRVDNTKITPRNLSELTALQLSPTQAADLYPGSTQQTLVSPSLSLAYALQPKFFAYAQYKHGGRVPGPGELYGTWNMDGRSGPANGGPALIGNKDLKPEKSDAFEIGLKGTPTKGVTLNTSVFYTKYRDFIGYTRYTRAMQPEMFAGVPSHRAQIYRAENRDQATIHGFELSSRLDHGTWSPALQGVYSTWGIGISSGNSISNYAGDRKVPLETVLPRKAVIGIGYDAPARHWGVNLIATFVAGKQAQETNRDSYANAGQALDDSTVERFRVPDYAVFDVSTYWQIGKNARLNAGMHNLTNKRYWDYSSARRLQPSVARDRHDMELLTSPGRTLFVNLTASF